MLELDMHASILYLSMARLPSPALLEGNPYLVPDRTIAACSRAHSLTRRWRCGGVHAIRYGVFPVISGLAWIIFSSFLSLPCLALPSFPFELCQQKGNSRKAVFLRSRTSGSCTCTSPTLKLPTCPRCASSCNTRSRMCTMQTYGSSGSTCSIHLCGATLRR